MTLTPAFLDELRARSPLHPVVARRVKLTRAGREWKGCCPFHNEKTPSFYVNDDKGFYHCFGCGAHGDVIRFLTEQEGLGFVDAVKQLAQQAGMEMPAESPEARAKSVQQEGLQGLAGRAADLFAAQLKSPAGAEARAYLDRRGVAAAAVKDFALGFAPDSRSALRTVLKDAGDDKLVEAGLLGRSDDGETYDRFRGRLMFPIRDARGRVVGFGGRALSDVQPKYLNSADGPLFDKGRLLYNLDRAAPAARKSGRLIVVEGYMDVIGLAGAGIVEAVAPLGTAMTEAQLELAWRQTAEPILCFDGDAAGQRAALRACLRALPLLQPGRSLKIATLPPGEDPDDLVKRGGAAAFELVLASAEPLIERLWRAETEGIDTATPERRAAVRQRLRDHTAEIAHAGVRDLYAADLSARFEAAYLARPARRAEAPFRKGARFAPPPLAGASPALRQRRPAAAGGAEELALLTGLLVHPALANQFAETIADLPLGDMRLAKLRSALFTALAASPGLDMAGLRHDLNRRGLGEVADSVRKSNRLAFSFTRPHADSEIASRDFGMLADSIVARRRIDTELAAATARFRTSLDDADFARQQALLAERREIDQAMMRLAESLRDD